MSIVRVGLSENQKFADGYDAIFGTKKKKHTEESDKPKTAKAKVAKSTAKDTKSKKKTPAKKK